MQPHVFLPSSLLALFLFTAIVFLSIEVPSALCGDDPQYLNCNRTFDCGNVQGVGYPFWGDGRPSYCGPPEFRLIDTRNRILKVARVDVLDDGICKTQPGQGGQGYPYDKIPAKVSCPYNGDPTEVLYIIDQVPIHEDYSSSSGVFRWSCKAGVSLPVPPIPTEMLVNNIESNLSQVIRQGFQLGWNLSDASCTECWQSSGQCGYNSTLNRATCFCRHGSSAKSCSVGGSKLKVAIVASFAGTFTLVAILSMFYCIRRNSSTKNDQKVEELLKDFGSLAPTRYKYSDVKKMTNCFKDKIGQGGYGGVFKGELIDGRLVAVKVLCEFKGTGEEFINEVASISRTSHVNIVTLLGYCIEGPKRALIYEFMQNGSLEKFIYGETVVVETHPHLGMYRRYQIAVGIAQGLEYLHRGCKTRIVHFDIKPHNILLDQDFCPKISDFGLAKLCLRKESIISMVGARGTVGYIAPEVFSRNFGGVSHKSDVYSYGMMVLEMVGGRKNIDAGVDRTSEIYFPHWIYKQVVLEKDLGLCGVMNIGEEEAKIARKLILVGLWCIQTDPANRPPMNKVVEMLEGSVESLQIPPKPFIYSPPRSPAGSSTT
uniref:Protein kinase domain-containing protein n=1 Tax=Nelumbo nucifera TaxID=4432 RepID=A0A822YH59_NELNU|nr:TPA_asm: hypothetical protein HUJ06_010698 [Nelumbo nucifera]